MILYRLLCKLFGHKWRRLTKKERLHPDYYNQPLRSSSIRICRRCSAERIVKARKTKTKEATNVSTTS